MQYDRQKDGTLLSLPKPSIDTGMGLERIIAIKEGVLNNFDSSVFKPIINKIEQISPIKITKENIGSFRVIADHIRAVSFMLSDGILFDKEGRGYVLRRILRRAVRHGYLLGLKKPFIAQIIDTFINTFNGHYSFLEEKKEYIKEQITLEEDRFFKTIQNGMSVFEDELKNTQDIFNGEIAFKLYDTYGFPLDLTQDMLRDKNIIVDIQTFENCMNEQKIKAKASWKGSGDKAKEGDFKILLEKIGINKFIGYDTTNSKSKIVALLDEDFKQIDILEKNNTGWVMLDFTPFYATSGGQVGDIGALEDKEHIGIIKETSKFFDLNLSKVEVVNSSLKVGEQIDAIVVNREEVAKHHSATHLLQSALRMVFGETVSQAGSLNDDKRLRFDFTYSKAMTQEQLNEVEDLVNSMITHSIDRTVEELPIEEAKTKGAIAMFGEKYGQSVRVVEFKDVSVEFCGGTHIKNTSQIGSFYITKESGVSAGVRRIEAVCGLSAISYVKNIISNINNIQQELKTKDILSGISKLKEQNKQLKTQLNQLQNTSITPLNEQMIDDIKVVVDIVPNGDIKKIVDDIKNENNKVAIFLIQINNNKVSLVSGVKNVSIKAGAWIKAIAPIVKGGGGGRDDFAQAGGKDVTKIQEAKEEALKYLKEVINE
jgi:alanyl-tRNA synthetase